MTGPSDYELLAAVLLVCAGAACLVWAVLAPFRTSEPDHEERA